MTLLVAAAALLAVGCSENTPTSIETGPNTIHGYVLVHDPDAAWKVDGPCSPAGPLGDLAEGTDVVVKDGSGKAIGTAELPEGVGEEDEATDQQDSETHVCEFPFDVVGVATTDTYVVQVADRPAQTVPLENIKARFWQLFFEFPGPVPR